ncbi:glucosaminidase domain-containing protein [Crocinitomicaceae bacterium]|nr:glucosaminidase domain-containing protein [Crocinitomicaceae bacterium]
MKFNTAFILLLFTAFHSLASEQDNRMEYVENYSSYAIQNMRMYRIPASITLAQGILESGSGKSELARKSNNHFGIKCGSHWSGGKTYHDDDAKNECFRAYKSVLDSYNDHSKFLTSNNRYSNLFTLQIDDYRSWAKGLSKAGYATNPNYASRLISIIEDLKLYSFDEGIKHPRPIKEYASSQGHKVHSLNDLNIVKAKNGDTYYKLAKRFGLTLRQIHKYNNTKQYNQELLKTDDIVYLEPKRFRSKKNKFIVLSKNSSPIEISQVQGIRLNSLMRKNHYSSPDEQLRKGEKVFLR